MRDFQPPMPYEAASLVMMSAFVSIGYRYQDFSLDAGALVPIGTFLEGLSKIPMISGLACLSGWPLQESFYHMLNSCTEKEDNECLVSKNIFHLKIKPLLYSFSPLFLAQT